MIRIQSTVNLSSDGSSDEDTDSSDSDSSDDNAPLLARNWCPIKPDDITPPPPRFPFLGNPGIKRQPEDKTDILQYVKLFLDNEIMERIVRETNLYAEQFIRATRVKSFSRMKKWVPVTIDEMWTFLGIVILQGILGKPKQAWYWSTNKMLETPFFREVMTENRFTLIMKCLHFANNEAFDANTHKAPKLKKIFELFEAINKNFQAVYVPETNLSIDESLVLYKGRLSWIQYIATKRARFGIKFYMMCESSSGYIVKCILYTGKGTLLNEKYEKYGFSTSIVLSLADTFLDQGYCITMDNFYNSPELYDILLSHKTDAYGTLRCNRKGLPPDIRNKKNKLKRGEYKAWQKGKILVLQWKDKKDVFLISTVHNSSFVEAIQKSGKVIQKPKVVMDYNNTMGGVDRADQQMSFYSFMRKQQKKYYKKIFRHLLEQCVWNAYVIYKKNGNSIEHRDFLWHLVRKIMEVHLHEKRGRNYPSSAENSLRLIGRHFPRYIPPTGSKQKPTRCCAVCCSKKLDGKKIRKETRFHCEDCSVALCAIPCFEVYHTQANF